MAGSLPPPALDEWLAVPLDYTYPDTPPDGRVAVLVHLFFDDLAEEILGFLRNIPFPADLFITTDTASKRDALRACFSSWDQGSVDVRVVPNRGRDIAPKLVGLADVHQRYDYVLHLHGKKSPHWRHGAGWRRYLLETLLGSGPRVRAVFEAFASAPRLGMVLPRHWEQVRPAINWGFDFSRSQILARRLGVDLRLDQPLDFPSGSMFWARSAALRPLLALGLSFDDFPEEGFTGGSLAHAIERLYLRACERAGYTWIRIGARESESDPRARIEVRDRAALGEVLRRKIWLLGDPALRRRTPSPGSQDGPWLRFLPDDASRPRLTLLLPRTGVVEPTRIALELFLAIGRSAGDDADLRIVRFDAETPMPGLPGFVDAAPDDVGLAHPTRSAVVAPWTGGVPAPLSVRAREVFLVADWREARCALALMDSQRTFFGTGGPLVRLVLDVEAAVGALSGEGVAAAETWSRGADTLAIFGSALAATRLAGLGYHVPRHEILQQARFARPAHIPASHDARALLFLVDWAGVASAGATALIGAALSRWAREDPERAVAWDVVALGGPDPDVPLAAGRRMRRIARPAAATACEALLRRARVGLTVGLTREAACRAMEMAALGVAAIVVPDPAVAGASDLHGTTMPFELTANAEAGTIVAAIRRAVRGGCVPTSAALGVSPSGLRAVVDGTAMARRIAAMLLGVGRAGGRIVVSPADPWPVTPAAFRACILHEMFVRLDAQEEGNADDTYPPSSVLMPLGDYARKQAAYLEFVIENHERLFQAFSLLGDDVSRDLYLQLILFRLLGHTRVRLPANTALFWQAHEAASRVPTEESIFRTTTGGHGLLHMEIRLDDQPYRMDAGRANALFSVFLRQYFLERAAVSVRPVAGDHVVDAGACFGDTAIVFAHTVGPGGRVYAFDPLEIHLRIMRHNIGLNPCIRNITVLATGLGVDDVAASPADGPIDPGFTAGDRPAPLRKLDSLVRDGTVERVDFIKMDIEGNELAALRGAEQVLRRFRPKLAISLYHRPEDYFQIPLYVASLGLGYRFWLENYTISDGETVLYATASPA